MPGDAETLGHDPHLRARREAVAQFLVEDPARPVLRAPARHHLERVLRVRRGESVVVNDGAGAWAMCTYEGEATLALASEVRIEPTPTLRRTVGFAPVKAERPEWMVQKLTELGVDEIVMLDTVHSVVRFDEDRAKVVLARLHAVGAEAAQQCRRVHLPVILGPATPAEVLEGAPSGSVGICDPTGECTPGGFATLLVGPEGGWEESERALGPNVSLGAHVLRAETAVIAAGLGIFAHPLDTVQ